MTSFFIDLWHDLREKRLWPVAVGLLAAIVAVPAILFKPASDAAPPAATTPHTGSADTLPVVAVESGPNVGSKLEAFDEKNPFKPMRDLAKQPDSSSDTGSGSDGSAPGGSPSGGGSAPGGSPSSGSPSAGSSDSSGGLGGGTPSGGSTSGGSTPTTTTTHSTTWFHYTAEFTFGTPGSPKKYDNVGNFTLLPDEKTPAIVFVGIGDDHKSAMFFVSDPAFEADGEGKCNAEGEACRFVTLKLSDSSDEETFTATDGSVSYDLKLEKINREELGSDKTPAAAAAPKNAKGIGATGAGVATAAGTAESLVPTMFATGPGVAREEG
jgi:hypothetical protein